MLAKRGFVFGKYMPFHNGHRALIDFAKSKSNELFVVVCGSDKERLPSVTRVNWIRETYSDVPDIKVIELNYKEEELPNTSVSSKEVSRVWANYFKSVLPEVDLLVTSEKYGEYVSEFMQIEHQYFDLQRINNRISATQIRESVYDNWHFLPDAVKRDLQKKVILLGTECTGKSSISKALSKEFNSVLVEEAGREIIQDSNDFTIEQVMLIAKLHAENIEKASKKLTPFVFIDTDIYITQSYAKYQFGEYLKLNAKIYEANKADFYFYLTKDLPYKQDGGRLEENERNKLDSYHKNTLKNFGINYKEISGDWSSRYKQINEMLKNEKFYIW